MAIDSQPPQVTLRTVAGDTQTPEVPVPALDPPVNGYRSGLAGARLRVGNAIVDADRRATDGGFVLVPKAPLAEGIYDLSAIVTDAAGNETDNLEDGGSGDPPKLVVDLAPPHVAPREPVPHRRASRPARRASSPG